MQIEIAKICLYCIVVAFVAWFHEVSYDLDYFYPYVDNDFRVTFFVSFRFLTLTSGLCYIHLHKCRIRMNPGTSILFTGPESQMEIRLCKIALSRNYIRPV